VSVTVYARVPEVFSVTGKDDAVEVFNLSNVNFGRLWRLLGLDFSADGVLVGVDLLDLQQAVDFVLEVFEAAPDIDRGLPVTADVGAHGSLWIDCGLRAGYFRERLRQLKPAVDRAVAAKGSLYWC